MEPMKPMKPMEQMKPMEPMKPMKPMTASSPNWWPPELANPASSGAQNGVRYAIFPDQQRLVVERGGKVTQYDTADRRIRGVSQQQAGDGGGSPTFASDDGDVTLSDLRKIG